MINIGSSKISEMYVGSTKIGSAYLGSTKVYEGEAPTPPGPSFDEVTIGTQTWMTKNLAIDDGGEGITIVDNVTVSNVNLGTQYYYSWAAAVRVAASITGWHLPTNEEFNTLVNTVGASVAGTKLKSTYCWGSGNGTDDYGFGALPVGALLNGASRNKGSRIYLWSASEYNASKAISRYFNSGTTMNSMNTSKTDYSCIVRLVKDT